MAENSKMKKPAAVIAAEALASGKAAELAAAKEAVRRLEGEYAQAMSAARAARIEADAALPQCNMVTVSRHRGTDKDAARVVILRKTPTWMLVVRRVGEIGAIEYKFKRRDFDGKYVQAEKESWYNDHRELRDVPAEYQPPAP